MPGAPGHAEQSASVLRGALVDFVATGPGTGPLVHWRTLITRRRGGAWRVDALQPGGPVGAVSIGYPLAAVAFLLCVFQVLLRPGVPFYREAGASAGSGAAASEIMDE